MESRFERGVFTLSFDFELVWGSRDLLPDPAPLARMARVTRAEVLPGLLALLAKHRVRATWATVGHLFLPGASRVAGRLHPDVEPPRHAWRPDWFAGVPEGTEAEHPEWYGRSLVEPLVAAGQDVGSHSFSHPIFDDPGCTEAAADSDLARCVREAAALGVTLRSFVFPRNRVGHLHLLARHGFTSYRGVEPTWYRGRGLPGSAERLAHLADVIRAACPATVMPERTEHGLVNVPASATFLPVDGVRRLIPMRRRVERCRRGLERAAADGRVFHLYTHPINLASAPGPMLAAFDAVLGHAARLRDAGRLDILAMDELADRTR